MNEFHRAKPSPQLSNSTPTPSPRSETECAMQPRKKTSQQNRPPYEPDPRDDTDPLAPPAEFRKTSYEISGESYDLRQQKLHELRQKIIAYDEKQRVSKPRKAKNHGDSADGMVHFKKAHDAFLILFLRSKEFRIESAFKKFLAYSKAHTEHPWLADIDFSLVERLFSTGSFQVLPSHDPNGSVILSMDIKILFPFVEELGKENIQKLLVALFGMLETICENIRAQLFGIVIVANLDQCKTKTLGYLSISQYLLSLEMCQHCFPLKANGMFLIHEPWYVRCLFNGMRPFMKPSVKESLLCFGEDISRIYSYIPRESLTKIFGGTLEFDVEQHTQQWVASVRRCSKLGDVEGTT